MPTATIIRFPAPIRLTCLRAFDARFGIGQAVAMFFCVPVQYLQHPAGNGDQDGGHEQAKGAVGEAE